jgi:hypothetical protein
VISGIRRLFLTSCLHSHALESSLECSASETGCRGTIHHSSSFSRQYGPHDPRQSPASSAGHASSCSPICYRF